MLDKNAVGTLSVEIASPPKSSVTLSAKALREALEFVNPDGPQDADQVEAEVTIFFRDEDGVDTEGDPLPRGLYCYLSEHPEEGCIPLFDVPPSKDARSEPPQLVAYAVSVPKLGVQGITGALKRSSALAQNLASAQDAGYDIKWTDFRAARAPEFDAVVKKHGMGCWTFPYARLLKADMERGS